MSIIWAVLLLYLFVAAFAYWVLLGGRRRD